MVSSRKPDLIDKVSESLKWRLGIAFTAKDLELACLGAQEETGASDTTIYRAQAYAKEIPIIWNARAVLNLYSFEKNIEPFDMLSAWSEKKFYLSHYSALYLHGLINQRPVEHFLSFEVRGHRNASSNTLLPTAMKQSFMKDYRMTSLFGECEGFKYTFIERADLSDIGVLSKSRKIDGGLYQLKFTDIERTLLDSIMAPQNSGGITTVIQVFEYAEIDLDKLAFYYKSLGTLYPYWQSIGFVLERTKGEETSNKWYDRFESPKIDFYLDKNARADWDFSEKWKLHFPKGLANGSR